MPTKTKAFPEIARLKMSAHKAIDNLLWVENELRTRYRELDLGEIPALREYSAIQRWKIDKVVPTPKALEVTGKDGGPLQVAIVRYTPPV